MQKATAAHESDIGAMLPSPGSVCNAHEVPFHCSASPPAAPDPTASQNVAETHETARRVSLGGPNWLFWRGVDCRAHDLPFHISARLARLPALSVCSPTASQKVADVQDSELSELSVAPPGSAACWSFQALPFQFSASGCWWLAVVLAWYQPAASQEEAAVHDTPVRSVATDAAGLGTDCAAQAVPFHLAANVGPGLLKFLATTSQDLADGHDTPVGAPARAGKACDAHVDPFHASAKSPANPVPTASQKLADAQDTAFGTGSLAGTA